MQNTGFFDKVIFFRITFQSQCLVIENHPLCKIGLELAILELALKLFLTSDQNRGLTPMFATI
jgi:hypothetical protein